MISVFLQSPNSFVTIALMLVKAWLDWSSCNKETISETIEKSAYHETRCPSLWIESLNTFQQQSEQYDLHFFLCYP